jgi:hypothetical protein
MVGLLVNNRYLVLPHVPISASFYSRRRGRAAPGDPQGIADSAVLLILSQSRSEGRGKYFSLPALD